MSDALTCPGCSAQFRVHIGADAPRSATVACPDCGTAIPLSRHETTVSGDEKSSGNSERPSTYDGHRRRRDTGSSTNHVGDGGPTTITDNVPGLASVDYSSVFGRTTPPPPGGMPPTDSELPEDTKAPGRSEPPGEPTELPDTNEQPTDSDTDTSPSARSLLQKLDRRQASDTPSVGTAKSPSQSQSLTQSATEVADPPAPGSFDDNTTEVIDDDSWFGDGVLEDVADAAADELMVVDDSPLTVDRLRGADDTGDSEPHTVDVEPDVDDLAPAASGDDQAPHADNSDTRESDGDNTPPTSIAQTTPLETDLSADDLPLSDTTYRLKIDGQVYGDVSLEALITMFRRGVWVVADEIAGEDGEWMPIESHPIFKRVRHSIADGVSHLLMTHGRLLDAASPATDGDRGPDFEVAATPLPPDDDGGHSREASTSTDPAPPPQPPPKPAPSNNRDQTTDQPTETKPTETSPPEAASTIESTASVTSLPWTIALITTGIASAAVAAFAVYALSAGFDDAGDTVDEPPAVASSGDDSDDEQAPVSSDDIAAAVDDASTTAADAADHSSVDLIEYAMADGQYRRARQMAAEAYSSTTADDEHIQELFDRAVDDDPRLHRGIRTIRPDVDADEIKPITEGASITLRLTDDGDNRYAYKVDRDEWEDGWRVEVAAYKLCEVAQCDLDIPRNDAARISRQDFEELYHRNDNATKRRYADQRFDELLWHTEEGPDGVERDYLYGTLKEWIPDYARWPIEFVETWAPWLDIDRSEVILEEDVDNFLERLDDVYRGPYFDDLQRMIGDHSTRQLARQMSNLHVFDFLTLNHDRYSGIDDYRGVNAHIADGRFTPIDNSSAFQFVDLRAHVLDRRLYTISRFSRRLIDSIRLMHPDIVDPVLFPDPSSRERDRLQLFWQQREKLLDYVDSLVDEYGEDAVYAFE